VAGSAARTRAWVRTCRVSRATASAAATISRLSVSQMVFRISACQPSRSGCVKIMRKTPMHQPVPSTAASSMLG